MGRRSILSLSGLDSITRFVCVKTSGCGLILLTITKSSHSGPQSRSLAGTGVVCPFAESGNRLDPISRPCSQPQHFRTLQRIFSREQPVDSDSYAALRNDAKAWEQELSDRRSWESAARRLLDR